MYLFYHKTNENANVYSENLFDFSLDKQMFVYYDTDIQTAVRNKCSHVMEGVYEKQKKKREKAEFSFLIALSMVLFIIMCSACFGTIRAQAADETSAYKYYTSIQITPGQTLNDIAGIYMTDDYKDTSAYIEEVCMINHIFPDDIHEGEYLTVPYYSAEYLK